MNLDKRVRNTTEVYEILKRLILEVAKLKESGEGGEGLQPGDNISELINDVGYLTSDDITIPNIQQVANVGNLLTNTSLIVSNGVSGSDPANQAFISINATGLAIKGLGNTSVIITGDTSSMNTPSTTVLSPFNGNIMKMARNDAPTPTPTGQGYKGEIRYSSGFVYLCTAANTGTSTYTWVRFAAETTW